MFSNVINNFNQVYNAQYNIMQEYNITMYINASKDFHLTNQEAPVLVNMPYLLLHFLIGLFFCGCSQSSGLNYMMLQHVCFFHTPVVFRMNLF